MQKNIDTRNSEFSANLILLINESGLPACTIRLNLELALSQIKAIEQKSITDNLAEIEKEEGTE